MRFLISAFVAAVLAATPAVADPEAIEFSDLPDPLAMAFDDPYADMGLELLNELKVLVQLDQKLAGDDLTEETRLRLDARRTAARETLEANGQDVAALLEQRWEVARKRQAARMATNPILDGVEVAISGYIIPAPPAADGGGLGYLVPTVGMCSHLPPPPPNQLVRVSLPADHRPASLYTQVNVTGLLRAEPSDATIFILDGEARMLSGWTLRAAAVDLSAGGAKRTTPWIRRLPGYGPREPSAPSE
ncbi:DUF3299 domain-containing protein [Albimonas sp. CAU 1670]|uniref:DUF3299 domain-containing protein n=1 Tax=Albimonas sp. CAU 1670 TaxID=3032599 RepID=UPI0023DAA76D|nr:DUF3299 domain-containing protein [Albimonas sp. CAU 1670]MDF2233162.1 DUF3299 domain-containing protein [Albimonas sp. CAU 1670]